LGSLLLSSQKHNSHLFLLPKNKHNKKKQGRDSHRPQLNTRLQAHVLRRVKYMVGYADDTREKIEADGDGLALTEFDKYGLGTVRTGQAYLNLTNIDPVAMKCGRNSWCAAGTLE
jgi:hypothetical protein